MMNERIRSQRENPFLYRYVTDLSSMDQYEDSTCVVMASPVCSFFCFLCFEFLSQLLRLSQGMLQNGLSREFFEMWCGDKRNSCVVPGYCVSGTLAKEITEMQVTQITAMNGQKLPLNCAVSYISFSAHADYDETSKFIEELRPTLQHVVCSILPRCLLSYSCFHFALCLTDFGAWFLGQHGTSATEVNSEVYSSGRFVDDECQRTRQLHDRRNGYDFVDILLPQAQHSFH
jgi:hypothetical protein